MLYLSSNDRKTRRFESVFRREPATMPDLSEYMTTAEAASQLGFHVQSIRHMVYNGTLEGIKAGRSVLVLKKSVAEYIEKTEGMSKNDPRRGREQN